MPAMPDKLLTDQSGVPADGELEDNVFFASWSFSSFVLDALRWSFESA